VSSEDTTVHPRDFRVSDDEREHVVQLLQKAIGRGLIDLDEFTERTDIAYAAMTRGQLNVVLSDLPGLVHAAAPQPGARRASNGYVRPSERLELVGSYSNLVREGRWLVPEYVLARNKYGNTRLDFTDAEFTTDVVNVELDSKWGGVQVVIPEGAVADTDGITEIKFGSVEDRTRSGSRTGSPRIVLTGRVHGGQLQVRYPKRGIFGQPGRSHHGHRHGPWGCR
jgi:hypothetical protein